MLYYGWSLIYEEGKKPLKTTSELPKLKKKMSGPREQIRRPQDK